MAILFTINIRKNKHSDLKQIDELKILWDYMSKTIVEEHYKGSLNVANTDDGVYFKIIIGE
ncbi:MAG: hypothetical protein J7J96_03220 [Sulfurimonas sp.]|nr:hypothetical protein [Sulfurimonas sp.]